MPVLTQIDETTSIPLKFILTIIAVSSAAIIAFGRWLFNINGSIKAHEAQILSLKETLKDVTANTHLTNTEFRDSASDARERMARVETMVEVIYKQITQK